LCSAITRLFAAVFAGMRRAGRLPLGPQGSVVCPLLMAPLNRGPIEGGYTTLGPRGDGCREEQQRSCKYTTPAKPDVQLRPFVTGEL